jgi:hypothetical protein
MKPSQARLRPEAGLPLVRKASIQLLVPFGNIYRPTPGKYSTDSPQPLEFFACASGME